MNKILVSAIVALAVVISACDNQSGVNTPTTSGANTTMVKKLATDLNLSTSQIAVVDEMFYMGEDLGLVLNAHQNAIVEGVIGRTDMMGDRGPFDRHRAADMAAIMWIQLILKANPDLDAATIDALKNLVAENYQKRLEAIKTITDPAELKAALQALHDELMAAINQQVGPGAVQKAEELKALLEKQRQELRDKMQALRIDAQVNFMTRALGLTAEQAASLKAELTRQQAAIEALRLQYKDDPEGFRTALKELLAQHDLALKGILTTAQYELWLKIRAGRGPIGPGGGGERGGGGRR